MKILKNKTYRELVNSDLRLNTRLNSEISENSKLITENSNLQCHLRYIQKNLQAHQKALAVANKKAAKYDAELERQRIKNQKYRDAKKAKVSEIEKFVKENLGREIKIETHKFGKICGHDGKTAILLGFNTIFGWNNPTQHDII